MKQPDHEDRYGDLGLFWAKSIDDGDSYLPLLQHAEDVAGVIETVADRLVSPGRKAQLQKQFGEIPLSTVLKAAAWFHDCGKISAFFQPKVGPLYNRVAVAGYRSHATPKDMAANPHSIVGAHAVSDWLVKKPGVKRNRQAIRGWKYVIGGHHGVFPVLQKSPSAGLESEEWQGARERFLDYGMELLGIGDDEIVQLANLPWSSAEQVLVNAILIAADWVGSSERYFPYDDLRGQARLTRALDRLDLGGVWEPSRHGTEDFAQRFGLPENASMRSVQQAAVELAEQQNEPFFMLVENVTGGGKTELALTVADIAARRFDFNGLFFAQPTRVTSDAMLSRVLTWLETGSSSGESISTILAHGKAEFNEEFQELTRACPTAIYDDESDLMAPMLEAPQWFRGRKTSLLASVVVGTIDQLLFAALKSKHVALRHLGLANKVVIIDEIHAADDYMREYLLRVLEWLGRYQVPVIALSATLPFEQRKQLVEAYRTGGTGEETTHSPEDNNTYPRITVSTVAEVATVYPEPDEGKKTTHVEFLDGDLEELAGAIMQESENGGCIAVICSTINRAQKLYKILAEQEESVELLHSRFIAEHRFEKERLLVEALGKNGTARPEKLIVVSTQIIEQGLDLDFDLMFSDIAPIDLLIQRIGRLHRHENLQSLRPTTMQKPRLVVVGAGIPNEYASAPKFPRGIVAVYRKAPLLRSTLVLARHLRDHQGAIVSPDHVAMLVNAAYSDNLRPPKAWKPKWEDAAASDAQFRTEQRERARDYRVPPPTNVSLEEWSSVLTPADELKGVAQVRDADESLEVIVVQKIGDRLYSLPYLERLEGVPVDGCLPIDWEVGRLLARCTLRLPGWLVNDEMLEELEGLGQESWQQNPWLAGQLPFVLNENLRQKIGGHLFTYDETFGLLIEKVTPGEDVTDE